MTCGACAHARADDGAEAAAGRARDRERARSAPAKAPAPVAAGRVRPQDPPPRERAGVPASERATDADDPGAIIDWLMKSPER